MKIISKSIADTARIAEKILKNVSETKQAAILALYGDLGSGKTAFVQELGKPLGVKGSMQSPTFVIMKSYDISYENFRKFIHIDAYRLEKPEELLALGWDELLKNPKNLIAIEWAERVEALLPKKCVRVHLKFIDETRREISFG